MTTSQAAIEKAYREARDQFQKSTQREFGSDAYSMSEEAVVGIHSREVTSALATFEAKTKALPKDPETKKKLETLREELNRRLEEFLASNSAKTKNATEKGKAAFEKSLQDLTNGRLFCLHPLDVENVHILASQAGEKAFDNIRKKTFGQDWDRQCFVGYMGRKVIGLRLLNTKNNMLIIAGLTTKYFNEILVKVSQKKLTDSEFLAEHERARARVLTEFNKKRNRPTDQYAEDPFKSKLEQEIMPQYSHLKAINNRDDKELIRSAMSVYDASNRSPITLRERCLHPEDLKKDHDSATCKALKAFRPDRSCSDVFRDPNKAELLHSILESRYKVLAKMNRLANETAEEAAFLAFTSKFDELTNRYFYRWYGIKPTERRECLDKARVLAFNVFYAKRRDGKQHATDVYVDSLKMRSKGYAVVSDDKE